MHLEVGMKQKARNLMMMVGIYIQKSVVSIFGASVIHTNKGYHVCNFEIREGSNIAPCECPAEIGGHCIFLLNISAALILKSDIQILKRI